MRRNRAAGNGGGDPALATDAHDGARGDGNSEGGPALAMDARSNDTRNGDVRGPPAQGKVTSYGTDTAAGAAANDAECCHERGINKRGATQQPTEREGRDERLRRNK